jgi:hypothetical protein
MRHVLTRTQGPDIQWITNGPEMYKRLWYYHGALKDP